MLSTLLECQYTPEIFLSSSNPELRRLVVKETESGLEIDGWVSCYYVKQLAQETLRRTADGRRIVNRVTVVRQPAKA